LYSFINKPLIQDDKIQKLYLILLNNNRTNILSKDKQRNILSCIQCGACLNVCPIYNIVGGHTYEEYNPGPVGSISLPLLKDIEETSHFCSLCTLCGRCSEICPVNIPLKDLFLENRKDLLKIDKSLIGEKNFLNNLMKKMINRKNLDKYGASFKDMELSYHIKKKWGSKRELPKFAKESFSEYWKNINNNK
jgi:L-lactate dehydrogenase complex protein LldF